MENADNNSGIEFRQEAYDLVARMEKLDAEREKDEVFKAGDKVRICMPLAGIPGPEETGLPHEVIMDEGHTGVIVRSAGEEMVTVRWDAGKYRIYKDLDLATMQYLDNGSLTSEGFESGIHTSYLQKSGGSGKDRGEEKSIIMQDQPPSPPVEKKSSLKELNHLAFYEEAETVAAAKDKILSQIPEGQAILLERIIDAGRAQKLIVHGRNTEECSRMAEKLLPGNITILKRNTLKEYRKLKKNVSAFTVSEAMQLVTKDEEFVTVSSLVLTGKGKSGLLGLIKKPDQYEAELEQDEISEIIYKNILSKVYIRTGTRTAIPVSLTQYDDLPEVFWSCTQLKFNLNGINLGLLSVTALKEQMLLEMLKTKSRNEILMNLDRPAEDFYLAGLLGFTLTVCSGKVTFTDYEPVCYYLIDHYKNRLLPDVIRIKNGERVVYDLPLYKTFAIDKKFGHYEKWQLDSINHALEASFKSFWGFLFPGYN